MSKITRSAGAASLLPFLSAGDALGFVPVDANSLDLFFDKMNSLGEFLTMDSPFEGVELFLNQVGGAHWFALLPVDGLGFDDDDAPEIVNIIAAPSASIDSLF